MISFRRNQPRSNLPHLFSGWEHSKLNGLRAALIRRIDDYYYHPVAWGVCFAYSSECSYNVRTVQLKHASRYCMIGGERVHPISATCIICSRPIRHDKAGMHMDRKKYASLVVIRRRSYYRFYTGDDQSCEQFLYWCRPVMLRSVFILVTTSDVAISFYTGDDQCTIDMNDMWSRIQ